MPHVLYSLQYIAQTMVQLSVTMLVLSVMCVSSLTGPMNYPV